MKNDIPKIRRYLHISDQNLLQHEFHHMVFKFHHKISGGQLLEDNFLAHKICAFLNMHAKLVLKN